MISNLDKYKKDLEALITRGLGLYNALQYETSTDEFEAVLKKQFEAEEIRNIIESLPDFKGEYQGWYSEAKSLIGQLLPDRVEDFARLYEKPKQRKELNNENYSIEDALHGLSVRNSRIGPASAFTRMRQQAAILEGARARFESSLFDIRQLLQADLFDSELEAAAHLLKNKFTRAAGALAGVVLEKHLGEVCLKHNVSIKKKDPSISELNDALKNANVIEVPQWRFVQHLGDIRNLCDHSKKTEPTNQQVQDLIEGVAKIIKTVF